MDLERLGSGELRSLVARAAEELRTRERRDEAIVGSLPVDLLDRVFDSIGDGVIVLDAGGTILFANKPMGILAGIPVEHLVGSTPQQAWGEVVRSNPKGTQTAVEVDIVQPGGNIRHATRRTTSLSGEPPRDVAIYRDETRRKRAEFALRRKEAFYRTLIERSAAIAFSVNRKGGLRFVSTSLLAFHGGSETDLIGKPAGTLFHPDSRDLLADLLDDILEADSKALFTGDVEVVSLQGERRLFNGQVRNLLEDSAVQAIVFNLRDVTSERDTEVRLRRQNELLAVSMRTTVSAIVAIDRTGVIDFANRSAHAVLGVELGALAGRSFFDACVLRATRDAPPLALADLPFDEVRQPSPPFLDRRFYLESPGEEYRVLSVNAAPLRETHRGRAGGVLLTILDVTERHRLEQDLRQRLQLEAALAEFSTSLVNRVRETDIARSLEVLRGLSGAHRVFVYTMSPEARRPRIGVIEACASSSSDPADPPEKTIDMASISAARREALERGSAYSSNNAAAEDIELHRRQNVGAFLYLPLHADECLLGFLGLFLPSESMDRLGILEGAFNIAALALGRYLERRYSLRVLQESEARFRELADHLPEGLIIREREQYLYVNPAFEEIWGLPAEQILGDPNRWISEIFEDDLKSILRYPLDTIWEGAPIPKVRFRIRRPDGEVRWIESTGFSVHDPSGKITRLATLTHDITLRVAQEEKLRSSEQRFRSLAESAEDLIYRMRWGGPMEVAYLSPAFTKVTGEDPSAFALAPEEFFNLLGWTDRFRTLRFLARASRGVAEAVLPFQRRDGKVVWLEHRAGPLDEGPDGEILLQGIARNVTSRLLAEDQRQALEARVLHTQKLESLSVLAGGIAHDYNNLLAAVLGNVGLAQMESPSPEIADCLEKIEAAGMRMAELTRHMLAYSGRSPRQMVSIDLNRTVHDLSELLNHSMAKSARLVLDLETKPLPIRADSAQTTQIIISLVANASDALQGRDGLVRLRTRSIFLAEGLRSSQPWTSPLEPGEYVALSIQDNGVGISEDALPRIFDPFYTTKFHGRGLGLAAVLGIVNSHGGSILVDTEPGHGTVAHVYYPLAPTAQVQRRESQPSSGTSRGAGETVLVVDDEDSVRNMIRRVLESYGYRSIGAAGGQEALAILDDADAPAIDAAFIDLTMPGMDGAELAHLVQRRSPSTPIVIMSGYSEAEVAERVGTGEIHGFMPKPFAPKALLGMLQGALAAAREP